MFDPYVMSHEDYVKLKAKLEADIERGNFEIIPRNTKDR